MQSFTEKQNSSLTLGTVDNSQKSLFRTENGSKLRSIRPFSIALFRTSMIE